ncbi:hypothetical protein NYE48_27875 [Paenibacillus sp. FSL M7-1455]|uniref:hypothetical protein n=1 Tax=Paenibacillus sp. FSL M7-1455 TaxID=2975316 RepID=UPI0030F5AFA0
MSKIGALKMSVALLEASYKNLEEAHINMTEIRDERADLLKGQMLIMKSTIDRIRYSIPEPDYASEGDFSE